MFDIIELNSKKVAELREIAKELDIKQFEKLKKQDLIYQILDEQAVKPAKTAGNTAPKQSETPNDTASKQRRQRKPVESEATEKIEFPS
ncbi:MAG: hypothetical protein RL226_2008, partial [Bacteroidota bacterium]